MVRSDVLHANISGIDLCMAVGVIAGTLLLLFATPQSQAQTFTVLHAFTGGVDGGYPGTGLTMDRAGNLYGTTGVGGPGGYGTVFKMTHRSSGWELSTLYSFHGGGDGNGPETRVIFGPDGTLYGTTNNGGLEPCNGYSVGCGVVYNLRPPATACKTAICYWTENVTYTFDGLNAGFPIGDIAFDQRGNLYGSASVMYELSPSNGSWTLNVLNSNVGSYNGVALDAAGNVYGEDDDYVFRLVPEGGQWLVQNVYSLNGQTQGYGVSGLTFDAAGNIYAGTSNSGPNGSGTVFELTPSDSGWDFHLLYAFSGNGSGGPGSGTLLLDSAGDVYGAASEDGANNVGSVFKLTPFDGGWTYTDLHDFHQLGSDGCYPQSPMVQDAADNLYGVTAACGSGNPGYGVVFEITP